MRRREFITLLSGAAAAWPRAARAQQPAMPVVGFLNSLAENDRPNLNAAFRRGLAEAGYVEGRKAAVIAATGGGASILASIAATKTIPIVFTTGGDPVQQGYVRSLNRPGGKVTGVSWFGNLLASKGLGLLHELIPNAAVIAQLLDPNLPETVRGQGEAHEAARSLGQQL